MYVHEMAHKHTQLSAHYILKNTGENISPT